MGALPVRYHEHRILPSPCAHSKQAREYLRHQATRAKPGDQDVLVDRQRERVADTLVHLALCAAPRLALRSLQLGEFRGRERAAVLEAPNRCVCRTARRDEHALVDVTSGLRVAAIDENGHLGEPVLAARKHAPHLCKHVPDVLPHQHLAEGRERVLRVCCQRLAALVEDALQERSWTWCRWQRPREARCCVDVALGNADDVEPLPILGDVVVERVEDAPLHPASPKV